MVFWLYLWTAAQAAPEPDALVPTDVVVRWRARTARLHVAVPDGQHVALEAPLQVDLEVGGVPWLWRSQGIAAAAGIAVPIPASRPVPLEGTLTVSVCADAGTTCRVVEQTVRGVLDGARGRGLVLEPVKEAPSRTASPADVETMLAAAGDGLVLIEFGAVWCAPCSLLSAELLHDPDDAALFDGIRLFEVDVDDHASWTIKDRFAVGGYPTLVAVDASGGEVARMVGYPGEAAAKEWLAALDTTVPLSRRPEPASLSPEAAGAWALRFVQEQRADRAAPYFERAAEGERVVRDAQLATYMLQPTASLARQLSDAGLPVTAWGWSAMAFIDADPTMEDRIRAGIREALAGASGQEAAGLLSMLAAIAPEAARPDLYRAAAVTLSSALSGDLDRDRGYIDQLSRMWRNAGELDKAAAVLEQALARWPEDMTFHEDRAKLALRTGDLDTAIREAALAVEHGLGDNRLRALATYAKALHAAGRTAEAVMLVEDALDRTIPPAAGVQVRTPAYLDALRALPFMAVGGPAVPAP